MFYYYWFIFQLSIQGYFNCSVFKKSEIDHYKSLEDVRECLVFPDQQSKNQRNVTSNDIKARKAAEHLISWRLQHKLDALERKSDINSWMHIHRKQWMSITLCVTVASHCALLSRQCVSVHCFVCRPADGSEEKKKDGSPVRSSSTSKDSGSSEKRSVAHWWGHFN